MKKIISLLEEKIREAENETSEDYSEDFLKGYKNGLKHAKIIIQENNAKERLFYDTEMCEVLNEENVRKTLFNFEVNDLLNNNVDFLNNDLDLNVQLECIKHAKNDTIEKVLDRLSSCWDTYIIELKIKEK